MWPFKKRMPSFEMRVQLACGMVLSACEKYPQLMAASLYGNEWKERFPADAAFLKQDVALFAIHMCVELAPVDERRKFSTWLEESVAEHFPSDDANIIRTQRVLWAMRYTGKALHGKTMEYEEGTVFSDFSKLTAEIYGKKDDVGVIQDLHYVLFTLAKALAVGHQRERLVS